MRQMRLKISLRKPAQQWRSNRLLPQLPNKLIPGAALDVKCCSYPGVVSIFAALRQHSHDLVCRVCDRP